MTIYYVRVLGGPVLSLALWTHLTQLGKLSSKQIAALVGVAPLACESGVHAQVADDTQCHGQTWRVVEDD